MLTDVQIASSAKLVPIEDIAASVGILPEELELYGRYKAKITEGCFRRLRDKKDGKLILVTAINPTPAGEGKTTVSVGLAQGLHKIGKKGMLALREPSLGPVFGIKGGAAGGGYSQVVPMDDINLHFTGDMHAIGAANNLLCALIDNHIYQSNSLGIDPKRIVVKRVVDMNDRALRNIVVGMGEKTDGVVREDHYQITVASEVMAILCLSKDLADLKERLSRMLIAYRYDSTPVYCGDLSAQGAMAALLKDAIHPNLVQTLEHTPCLIHGGPFANIAHGCNSLRATRLALKLADYVVTEAGFGADLGAEKFMDIKCRYGNLRPAAVVLVATVRALKSAGGVKKADLKIPDADAVTRGGCNLAAHIENIKKFGVMPVVALNRFDTDTDEEIEAVRTLCALYGVEVALCEAFSKGGEGAVELAQAVVGLCEKENRFDFLYPLDMPVEEKIRTIAKNIYGAADVVFESPVRKVLDSLDALGCNTLPVCMAKTQYSLSDDPTLIGRPTGFVLRVRDMTVSRGAGFVVALTGKIMVMPGLPKVPAAENIDIDDDGNITGLF